MGKTKNKNLQNWKTGSANEKLWIIKNEKKSGGA